MKKLLPLSLLLSFGVIIGAFAQSGTVPISSLPRASTLTGDEFAPIVQDGVTKRAPLKEIGPVAAPTEGTGNLLRKTGAGGVSFTDFAVTGVGGSLTVNPSAPTWSGGGPTYHYTGISADIGGTLPADARFGYGFGPVVEAHNFYLTIPPGSDAIHATALGGIVSAQGAPSGVGLFGGCVQTAAAANGCWSLNTVATNGPKFQWQTQTGYDFGFLGNELDVNVIKKAGGGAPTGNVAGLYIVGQSEVAPIGNYNGILIDQMGLAANIPWNAGVMLGDGAANYAVWHGTSAKAVNNVGSISDAYVSRNSGGSTLISYLKTDADGNFSLNPAGGSVVVSGSLTATQSVVAKALGAADSGALVKGLQLSNVSTANSVLKQVAASFQIADTSGILKEAALINVAPADGAVNSSSLELWVRDANVMSRVAQISGASTALSNRLIAAGAGHSWPATDAGGAAWGPRDSWAYSISPTGSIALSGFSRSSQIIPPYTANIGVGGFVIVDNAPYTGRAFYGDVQFESGQYGYGQELAVKNKGANVTSTPYFLTTGTYGLYLHTGDNAYGGAAANPSNTALLVGKGASTWNRGLVFGATSLTGTDGVTGTATAIEMAKGHSVVWRTPGNYIGAVLRSDASGTANTVSQVFLDDAISYYGASGGIIARLQHTANAVNYLRVANAVTGQNPEIRAFGSDTDVNLSLVPQGAGVVRVSSGFISGPSASQRNRVATRALASGEFATGFPAQQFEQVLFASSSSTSATRLTAGGAASFNNVLNLADNSAIGCVAEISARDTTTGDVAAGTSRFAVKRGSGAATTAIVGSPSWSLPFSSGTLSTLTAPSVTADTGNGGVNFSVTPPTSNAVRWTAAVRCSET